MCSVSGSYEKWHYHPHHQKVHFTALLSYVLAIGIVLTNSLFVATPSAMASESYSFDFSITDDFSVSDSELIELGDSFSRLKPREYTTDSDTLALYHANSLDGSSVVDSSGNANNGTSSASTTLNASGKINSAYSFDGTSSKITVPNSSSLNLTGNNTVEAWTKFDQEFTTSSHNHRQPILDRGDYKMYYDNESGKLIYELADASPSGWNRETGTDTTGGWDLNGKLQINSQLSLGSDIYVGTGNAISDAEVWKWNGSTWTQIGGDDLNSGWEISAYESVLSMTTDGTNVYAGLGTSAGDAEVWKWNGSSWSMVGGDGTGWAGGYYGVYSMNYFGNTLYAGLGGAAGLGEVWKLSEGTWSKIADDSLGFPAASNYEYAYTMANDGANLYVGMGLTANDADVWKYNGSTWSKIGGDAADNWNTGFEYVTKLAYENNTLYAGLGISANDAELWQYSGTGTAWTQIGSETIGFSANHEAVYSIAYGNGKLFAGLGSTAGDNDIYAYSGSAWTQIGGDGLKSGLGNTHTIVEQLTYADNYIYASFNTASASSELWRYTDDDMSNDTWDGTWQRVGGKFVNNSWGYYGLEGVQSMATARGKLYAGLGTSAGDALVWRFDGTTWDLIGGQGINSSWTIDTHESVNCMTSYKGNLYVGLGISANDAEVWMWNGDIWSKIGGDGTGWGANYDIVQSMTVYKDKLYVGLGLTANESEVWEYDGSDWTALPIGGDGRNSSWNSVYESVRSLISDGTYLYAGLGNTAGDAEVWRYDGVTWGGERIGGDGTGWANSVYQGIDSMSIYRGKLCVGLGYSTAGNAEVWTWDGSTWTLIGGDGNGWADFQYERVQSMAVYNGNLYASLGYSTNDGEIFRYDESAGTWTKVAGNAENNSWAANVIESATSLNVYKGKLYAGTGNTANADAGVWSYGSNGYVESTTIGQDTGWHHIAGVYNGSTMKIYIDNIEVGSTDATLPIKTSSTPLYIGSGSGLFSMCEESGYFNGSIDEIRISSTVRSTRNYTKFTATEQTIRPAEAVLKTQVKSWDGFVADESANGGSIKYRISIDNGATWKYWDTNAMSWVTSGGYVQTSVESDINSHISSLGVTSNGILWQAYLKGDGEQAVALDSVEVLYTADTTSPTNPTLARAKENSESSTTLSESNWNKFSPLYFEWDNDETGTGASDSSGSGVDGYYVYFGQTNESNECVGTPSVTPGLLSPNLGGLYYQTTENITIPDQIMTSGNTYCLRVQTKDKASNLQSQVAQLFKYKFDSSRPTLPSSVTVNPVGYTNTDSYTFTINGASTDPSSGVAKYQYRTGGDDEGVWYDLDFGSATLTLPNDDHAQAKYKDEDNYLYLRAVDNAGNYSESQLTTTYYFGASAPSKPLNVIAEPSTASSNSFTFRWDAPAAVMGDPNKLTYYYSINSEPTAYNTQSTYTTGKSVGPGAFATQQGDNKFFVVAKDEAGNIDWDNFEEAIFTANTANPPAPTAVKVSDISDKKEDLDPSGNSGEYRTVISWTEPLEIPDEGNFRGYRVYSSTTPDSGYQQIGETLGTAYVHLDLTKDETYYYYVTSIDKTNGESVKSDDPDTLPDPTEDMPHETATGKFKYPPQINENNECSKSGVVCDSENKVEYSVGAKTATISWNTSRNARPEVQYGTKPDHLDKTAAVSREATSSAQEVTILNMNPETTYYFRVIFTDEDGNSGVFPEENVSPLSFKTTPSPKVSTLKVENVTLDSMFITWQSSVASHGAVKFRDGQEGGNDITTVEESADNYSTDHSALLRDLKNDTAYLFQITALDSEGNAFESDEYISSTLPMPRVNDDLKIENMKNVDSPTITVSYTTNVETTTVIRYTAGGEKTYVDLNKSKDHSAEISGLSPKTAYIIEVTGTDQYGNDAISKNFQITTESDTMPPKIIAQSEKKRTVGDGESAEAQISVKLTSNEPTTMIVEAAEGIAMSNFDIVSTEDSLNSEHTVLLKLRETGKTYSYRVRVKDASGNETLSDVKTVAIQKSNKTAFEYAISVFARSFGWLQGKLF